MENHGFFPIAFATAGYLSLAIAMHWALRVAAKSSAPERERAASMAHRVWWGVVALTVALVAVAIAAEPSVVTRLAANPWASALPVIAMAGLLGVRLCKAPDTAQLAYFSSCTYLAGIVTIATVGAGFTPWPGALLAIVR